MDNDTDVDPIPAQMSEKALMKAVERREGTQRSRLAAAKELARRNTSAAGPLLARLLRDTSAPADLRSVAAVALGTRPGPEHERALAAALRAPEALVVRRAAEALGRIGGADALPLLRETPVPADRAAARALSFSRSLIAYRHGLGTELLRAPSPPRASGKTAPLTVGPAAKKLRTEAEARLSHELPAILVKPDKAVRIACERHEMLLLPAAEPARLSRQSGIPAVLMKRANSLGHFATHLYILSHPLGGGRIALFGVRPDGTVTHSGEGWTAAGAVRFRIQALDTPYADPTLIEGTMDEKGTIAITAARIATGARRKAPVPIKLERQAAAPAR